MTADTARARYAELQRLARELGRPTDELLTLHAMEAYLARVSRSRFSDQLVLKGGMLMSHLAERRPTRDIDLHTVAVSNDIPDIEAMTSEIAGIDIDDGIEYDTAGLIAEHIRDAEEYPGVRVALDARVHTARLRIKLDLSFGDPSHPEPEQIALDRLHPDMTPLVLMSFPITMVLAEKIVTAISRGTANTRWRDFADIIAITRHNEIDGQAAYGSIATVANHRGVELAPISDIIDAYAAVADTRWNTWHARQPYDVSAPSDFATTLNEVARFADVAATEATMAQMWRPPSGWVATR